MALMVDLGGTDIEFLSTYSIEESLHHAVRAVLEVWGSGVIEDLDTGKRIELVGLLGSRLSEVAVFKDLQALRSWTEHGWTEGNCRMMVHILSHPDGVVTCVVEDQEGELGVILRGVREGLLGGPRAIRGGG